MRSAIKIVVCFVFAMSCLAQQADSETFSLQDIVGATKPLPEATIYVAKEIVTLDPKQPSATAVAVVGDRILATGTLKKLQAKAGDQTFKVDRTFAEKIIVPGFIAQHDHPLLAALTMTSEIIAIEDWILPTGTVPAAENAEDYRQRLVAANAKITDPNELLYTWGYHQAFHGKITRTDLDKISSTRPIIIWHRSCHEFILNTKAHELLGIDQASYAKMSKPAQEQSNFKGGHYWEQGMYGILDKLLPVLANPERLQAGLEFAERYYHAQGVTLGAEPGGVYSKHIQDAINAVLSDSATPFRFFFIPDGKQIYTKFQEKALSETEKTMSWGQGMTVMMPKQVKLFADGAIYSIAMQLRQPPIGNYNSEWMMAPADFANAFRLYWEAGYQLHVHVNGDAGVDMVLDNLEANMRRHPRHDHRTVLVHFAVSQKDQVDRIKRLGAIISGNPYYVTMLADKYSEEGLGPERADNMVRTGDIERAGIPFSYHADMPMAPAQPLFLMHSGVNRITISGRVAGKRQRNSREAALKAITLEAAYSLQLEDEVGSIVPGKLANFTILEENPLKVRATKIKDIVIWGTVHEGRKLPVVAGRSKKTNNARLGPVQSVASLKADFLQRFSARGSGDLHRFRRKLGDSFVDLSAAGHFATRAHPQ